jgi:16S rRNA G966 N2-methylase RsmD
LATSRLFFSADPYNIYTIEKETRIAVIAKENRQTIIDQEKRVNIINDETRTYLVPQETRNLTIVRPPFKNRYSIPRTRAEA